VVGGSKSSLLKIQSSQGSLPANSTQQSYKYVVVASRGPSAPQMNSAVNEKTSVIHPTYSLSAAVTPVEVTADDGFTVVRSRERKNPVKMVAPTPLAAVKKTRKLLICFLCSLWLPKSLGLCLYLC
jgi:hypothetical protein